MLRSTTKEPDGPLDSVSTPGQSSGCPHFFGVITNFDVSLQKQGGDTIGQDWTILQERYRNHQCGMSSSSDFSALTRSYPDQKAHLE